MHPNVIDLTDCIFGKWTVIERGPNSKGRSARWWCLCECGAKTLVLSYQLRNSRAGGCKQCATWKGCGELSRSYWNEVRNNARQRGIEFDLTIEDAWQLFLDQNRLCAISQTPLILRPTYKRKTEQTASLDRIDSSLGYYPDNVQWVHKEINRMKGSLSDTDFLSWCEAVVNNHVVSI